jgi:predicted protein tyrosine phosphatase
MQFYISDLEHVAHIQEINDITKVLGLIEFDPRPVYSKTSKSQNTVIFVNDHEIPLNGTSPTMDTIKEILDFSASLVEEDRVLFHCYAGVSRSCAAALLTVFHHTRDAEIAKDVVKRIRPQAAPNRLIAQLGDIYFGNESPLLYNAAQELCVNRSVEDGAMKHLNIVQYKDLTNNKHL